MSRAQPTIDDVVAGRYLIHETGQPLRCPIQAIVIEPSLEGAEGDLVAALGLGAPLAVVADERTAEVMGHRVASALPGAELVVLERPKADEATAEALEARTRGAVALIAAGSGTLNDLCKYVTHRTGRRCAVFATAPSMDGYVTSTVSITQGGLKTTIPAHAPVGVFFDLGVLAQAPPRLIRAGLGDTVCRTTAQLDWLLSHLLLDTVYSETPYELMRADEPALLGAADRLLTGDLDAMERLTRLLVLSGLGVLVTGTTHCGSMGEHAISHAIDMLADPHPGSLHGEQVGLATWTMARLQAALLADPTPPVLHPLRLSEDDALRRFGRFAPACLKAAQAKPFDDTNARRLTVRLAARWPQIRAHLLEAMLPLRELERVVRVAGLPTRAGDLGLEPAFYASTVNDAHLIRDRYGFLDLAAQTGRLEAFAAGEG